MSCMMTGNRELAVLANYVEAILTGADNSGTFEGVKRIYPPKELAEALADCRVDGVWSAKLIFARLYTLNERAYNSRYGDDLSKTVPEMPVVYCDYSDGNIKTWAVKLSYLIRFFDYQCCEDDTANDPLRLAMSHLGDSINRLLAHMAADDLGCKWGVWA